MIGKKSGPRSPKASLFASVPVPAISVLAPVPAPAPAPAENLAYARSASATSTSHRSFCMLDIFISKEDGYTTISVALCLLLSLVLVFSLVSIHTLSSRAADIQEVSDAVAMSGSNCVAAYTTIVQFIDACVLSLGLSGMLVYAAGLVMSVIPILGHAAPLVLTFAQNIMHARTVFARSAYRGIEAFEKALPYLIAYNSLSCARANSSANTSYVGLAIPYPFQSKSVFAQLKDDVPTDDIKQKGEELSEASKKIKALKDKMRALHERAWRADCVDDPSSLRGRASTLAAMPDAENPSYTLEEWKFEYALVRASNYYANRLETEAPENDSWEEYRRSCARTRFYQYAQTKLSEVPVGNEDEPPDLPDLPHDRASVRKTSLYTEKVWPCSRENGSLVVHCSTSSMDASPVAYVSLQDIEQGRALPSETDGISLKDMGRVASASTNIDNGFEHYWRIIEECSHEYKRLAQEVRALERAQKQGGEEAQNAFSQAMQALKGKRPRICPPGAYGCVGVVVRAHDLHLVREFPRAFSGSAHLSSGFALSGATLAPDEDTKNANTIKSLADGIRKEDFPLSSSVVGSLSSLWSDILLGYTDAYHNLGAMADQLFAKLGHIGLGKIASWLKGKLSAIIQMLDFEPPDLRLKKPVRINTQYIFAKAGFNKQTELRKWLTTCSDDPEVLKTQALSKISELLGLDKFTIAEFPALGSGSPRPFVVDVKRLL